MSAPSPQSATAIGVDIGGTNLRAGRISASGEILQRASTSTVRDPKIVVASIVEMVAGLMSPDVAAIGVGVPGRVDARRQRVLSGGYVDLATVDLSSVLTRASGKPVFLDNDAGMALAAELAIGAARGVGNVAMFTIGTGIGGAIAEAGRIVHGSATAGQLGHIAVHADGALCNCGRRGCIETTSSGSALRRLIAEAGFPETTRIADLLRRSDEADPVAREVLQAWAAPLRAALDTVAATVDPELILLGGGLGQAAYDALSAIPAQSDWFQYAVRPAELGDDAGIIGAGLAALAHVGAACASAPRKTAILVNGVPASGKSFAAHAIADRTGWPRLALDTVKDPFLEHLGGASREFNRTLGRASYQAIWSIVGDAPAGSTFIVDAWFGFQPRAVLEGHLQRAGVDRVLEIWCHAPPADVAKRYAARLGERPAGHPGAEYVPELIELAGRAEPLRLGPVLDLDTTMPLDVDLLVRQVRDALRD